MSRIFVSYRRKESSGHAGRLFDRLCQHFGAKHVFRDVDDLKAGDDFVEALARAVDSADVFILVIGRDWADARDAHGKRRLDDPHDFIRLELETALKRKSLILPVLVEGAAMVEADSLPESLRPLARRQAIELSEHRWDFDVQELLTRIDEVVGRQRPVWKTTAFRVALAAAAVLLVAAGLSFRFEWLGIGKPNSATQETPASPPATQPNPAVIPAHQTGAVSQAEKTAGTQPVDTPRRIDPPRDSETKTSTPTESRKPEERAQPAQPDDSRVPPARPEPEKPAVVTGVAVPEVTGKEFREATAALRALGVRTKIESESSGRASPGTVIDQTPAAGTMVDRGEVIVLTIEESRRLNEHAAGRVSLSVTEVLDVDRDREGRQGWDIGFNHTPSDGYSLSFGGTARAAWLPVAAGTPISFDASACERVSPSLTSVAILDSAAGQMLCVRTTAGRLALIQLGPLTSDPPELAVRYSTLATRPTVAAPSGGVAPEDTPRGTATGGQVRMPQLVGQQSRSAIEILKRLGVPFKVESSTSGRAAPGTVSGQRPAADTLLDRGAAVQLHVEIELGRNEHAAGRFSRSPDAVIQLDRDEPSMRAGWDFALRGTAGTGFSLEFANGAEAALLRQSGSATTPLDPAVCRGLRLSAGRIPLVEPVAGQAVCVKTTRGRAAIVHLGRLVPDPPELFIRYSTFER